MYCVLCTGSGVSNFSHGIVCIPSNFLYLAVAFSFFIMCLVYKVQGLNIHIHVRTFTLAFKYGTTYPYSDRFLLELATFYRGRVLKSIRNDENIGKC